MGIGHNSGELKRIAEEAQLGLATVYKGEEDTIDGWLQYGAALNEGREMFPSNEKFGQWVVSANLSGTGDHDRAAAMWAAANQDEFFEIKADNPKVRTVRGLHAKWKEKKTEEKSDKVEKLVQRQRSTTSEGEKNAVQEQLDKMESSGVDVGKVISRMDAQDVGTQIEKKSFVAYEIVDLIYGKKDLIASCLIGLAKNEKQLEKMKEMLNG